MSAPSNTELMRLIEAAGLQPGTEWRLMKVDGRTELMVSMAGHAKIAEYAAGHRKTRTGEDQ